MRLVTIASLAVLTTASLCDLAATWWSTRHVGRTE